MFLFSLKMLNLNAPFFALECLLNPQKSHQNSMSDLSYDQEAYFFYFYNLRGFEANKTVRIKWYGNIVYTCLKKTLSIANYKK